MKTQIDLVITTREGETIAVSSCIGRGTVIGFLSKSACHTGPTLEVLDQILLDIGPADIQCIACIVDLDRGEELREYAPFVIPIGAASRRMVADFLGISMSGFLLPQFVVLDRKGQQRLLISIPRGDEFWEIVDNLKRPIEQILDEPHERAICVGAAQESA